MLGRIVKFHDPLCLTTARWSLFGSGEPMDFWQVILKFASPASVSSILDMGEIQTELGRVNGKYIYACGVQFTMLVMWCKDNEGN